VDFTDFPIAENTRTVPGLPFAILESVIHGLLALSNTTALTLCEINPHHARHETDQFAALIKMLVSTHSSQPPSPRSG
jgi:arginase